MKILQLGILLLLMNACGDSEIAQLPPPVIQSGEKRVVDPVAECQNAPKHTSIQRIIFPPNTAGCRWNESPNLSPIDALVRAHQVIHPIENFALPANLARACDIEFSADISGNTRFDDEIFITLNDRVLLSSFNYSPVNPYIHSTLLYDQNQLLVWDFNQIVNTTYAWNYQHSLFCHGATPIAQNVIVSPIDEGVCKIPFTETTGQFYYRPYKEQMNSMLNALGVYFNSEQQVPQLDFKMILTGDNDLDCYLNRSLAFTVKLEYIMKE